MTGSALLGSKPVGAARPVLRWHLQPRRANDWERPGARSNRPSASQHRATCAAASVQAGTPATTVTAEVALPPLLRNATAVLTSASGSKVYLLGVSHVSQVSCQQVEQLVQLVRPDIILVELCKERVPLLVNPDDPPPTAWAAVRTSLAGLPPGDGWPATGALLTLTKCGSRAAVSASEIEDDAVALLSTGLFASVSPAAKPAGPTATPSFLVGSGGSLQTVAPLGEVEFVVKERVLPRLAALEVDFDEAVSSEGLAERATRVASDALQQAAAGAPAVGCYLQARRALLELFPEEDQAAVEVVFSGVESGKARALVRRVPAGQRPSLTGLEGSAANGQGWGIQPFQRRAKRQPQQTVRIGASMTVDASSLAAPAGSQANSNSSSGSVSPQTKWRPWTEAERQQGEAAAALAASGGANPLSAAFATAISQSYAGFQAKAGRRVGVGPGAAWQAALRAAAACGAQQVLLGDRPAGTTAQRLANGIWTKWAPFLLGSIPAAAASAVIVSSSLDSGPLTPLAAAAAAALPLAAAAWPVAAPLLEISKFAGLSAGEIEEIVRVKEPVQTGNPASPIVKLWGEDALLNWPGAMDPIINERDAYMARSLAAAANGLPQGLTPGYILTTDACGRAMLCCGVPEGSNPVVCPVGLGEGAFEGLPTGQTVVGVVGTAHVRGIIREWEQAQRDVNLSPFV